MVQNDYVVLYRKYRPETLEDVVGRKHIVKTLLNAIEKNTISHAYLFCGTRGTGKTSLARIFAKKIAGENCEEDIIEIDAASNNGVDEIRSLIERVKFAPIKGKYKVYIIDEVHMLTAGAFNAFLKTIEEPPSYVVFILATTEPHKVLDTILSRCQRFDFKPFSDGEIIERLMYVSKKENIQIEEKALSTIAKLCNGGMRDALSILDQLSIYSNGNISVESLEDVYGVVSESVKLSLVEAVLNIDKESMLKILEENIFNKNVEFKLLIQDIISIIRDKIVLYNRNDLFNAVDFLVNLLQKMNSVKNIKVYFEITLLKIIDDISFNQQHGGGGGYGEQKNIDDNRKNIGQQHEKKKEDDGSDDKQFVVEKRKRHQNVSRETNSDVQNNVIATTKKENAQLQKKDLDIEYNLSLLVSASKEEKRKYIEAFNSKTAEILLHSEYIPCFTLWKQCDIFVAGNDFVLLSAPTLNVRDEIFKESHSDLFKKFINFVVGNNKQIFVESADDIERIKNVFLERLKNNTLPKKSNIKKIDVKNEEKKDNYDLGHESKLDRLKDVFQEKLEIREE